MNAETPPRLAALRHVMQAHGVSACLVPSADPHLSEYLPGHWQARAWLSGFTGSAGTLVITTSHAGLWTDGRYFEQAQSELEGTGIDLMKQKQAHAPEHLAWLEDRLGQGQVLAVAGDSIAAASAQAIARRLAPRGARLRTDLDLPGLVWPERPPLPRAMIFEHAPAYAAVNRIEKLGQLRTAMRKLGATHHLVSSLDDIAWMTNLRGHDVECNPVFLAHLLLNVDGGAVLFVSRSKLTDVLVAALMADGIAIADYASIGDALGELDAGDTLLWDPARVVDSVAAAINPAARRIQAANPSTLLKARKTPDELNHIREVMRRDGAALVRGFRRLEERLAAGMTQTELDVDSLLFEERSTQVDFVGESFATIAGYQANGALPHYKATPQSHSTLDLKGWLLIDSGGQYLGGTTDITRMLALGPVTDEQKRDSTLVLKGMIGLSRARFPEGASGPQLDALARAPLWAAAMDYGHGTGHGVGYFLNVHEGPHGIRQPAPGGALVPLERGMITSIEPGLYKPGRHGVRHENLAVVIEAGDGEFGQFLGFETLTLCPFDRRTLEPALLNPEEKAWLDDYHATVRAALAPMLDGADLAWLERHCAPLS